MCHENRDRLAAFGDLADRLDDAFCVMLNRCREIDRETTSLIDRTSDTGSPVPCRSCSRMGLLSEYGSTRVRTIHATGEIRRFSALSSSVTCPLGTYIRGPGSLFRPLSRKSETTPMISRAGSLASSRMTPAPIRMCSCTGSLSCQNCFAIRSLMTTTGGAPPPSPYLEVPPRATPHFYTITKIPANDTP